MQKSQLHYIILKLVIYHNDQRYNQKLNHQKYYQKKMLIELLHQEMFYHIPIEAKNKSNTNYLNDIMNFIPKILNDMSVIYYPQEILLDTIVIHT